MKKILLMIFVSLLFSVTINSQTNPNNENKSETTQTKPKRQIFRANKEQITRVQKMLKEKGSYTGEATGKLDDTTRAAIKQFQGENGLRQTGTLNRATLERMNIELTDAQKEIPVSPNSLAAGDGDKSDTPKRTIFRATKDQIMQAQRLLKQRAMYNGEETGKLDDTTRDGLRKFQEAGGLNVTGTLNQVTLEKMGIELTDRQKGIPKSSTTAAKSDAGGDSKPKRAIFRANKDQIMQAQQKLKQSGFYNGETTGKLDDATREGLKKYQEANGLKSTGTLNQVTLEKMGIELTDKQKESARTQ